MANKEVFTTLGFDRAGNLVECRRNGKEVPIGDAAALLSPVSDVGVPPDPEGGPKGGSDPCIVRLPSGQLIRVC